MFESRIGRLRVAARLAVMVGAWSGFAAAALAQPPQGEGDPTEPPRRGPPPIEDVMARHAEELGLDAATRASIAQIAERSRAAEQPLAAQLRDLHERMRALLESDSPKLDEVMQWADRIGAAETELKKQRLRTMLEVRALLTPEQRQKLVRIFEERRGRMHGMGHGPPPPEPPPE